MLNLVEQCTKIKRKIALKRGLKDCFIGFISPAESEAIAGLSAFEHGDRRRETEPISACHHQSPRSVPHTRYQVAPGVAYFSYAQPLMIQIWPTPNESDLTSL